MMGFIAAARSPRKHYLDRVLTVLLSLATTDDHSPKEALQSASLDPWTSVGPGARSKAAQDGTPCNISRANTS